MKRNHNFWTGCLCLSAVFLTAYVAESQSAVSSSKQATRIITDMGGRKVAVPEKIERVVLVRGTCNVPSIMSAFGIGNKLVSGLCFKFGNRDLQLKIEPAYAPLTAIFPDANGEINLEELMRLKPDVVMVWLQNAKNIDKIQAAGLPVVALNILTWDDLKSSMKILGDVFHEERKAAELLKEMDDVVEIVKKRVARIPAEKRKRVLFVDNAKGLSVPGDIGYNNFMIELSGGIPVTKDLPGYFATTSLENIYLKDPEIIMVSGFNKQGLDFILSASAWRDLRAVKTKKVYLFPRGAFMWNKPCAEAALGVLWQSYIFYPELYTEQEIIGETRKFYKKYYHYELQDSEIGSIFEHD